MIKAGDDPDPRLNSASFERVAQSSVGKTRRVEFLLYEQFAFEGFERTTALHQFESVVFSAVRSFSGWNQCE